MTRIKFSSYRFSPKVRESAVSIKSNGPINSFDFWFKFDLAKMTYDTTFNIGSLPYATPMIHPPSTIHYPSDIAFVLYHNDTMMGHISIMTNFNTTISWICESAYLSLPSHIKGVSFLNPTKTYISITGLDLY